MKDVRLEYQGGHPGRSFAYPIHSDSSLFGHGDELSGGTTVGNNGL